MGKAADNLGRVGAKLRTLPGEGVQHSTALLRGEITKRLKADTGDRRLSGAGRNAKPLTVKVTKRELGNLVEGRVMAGPRSQRAQWFWLNEGTKPGARRYRKSTFGISTNAFYHPGTPAKRTWSDPVGRVAPSIERHFEELHRRALTGR